ncbi:MAG TPA: D-alanine--poly(phosphoribitol) ligase subunit DltA [Candidatus Deferrimicrobium sp.]|nr:D-alanine--poly(phosphoribitol) ligase subunit DltA [Candidatus Deferrimicrobium sp.]
MDKTANNEFAANPRQNPEFVSSSEDVSYVIHTSGSTGTPKGVVETHRPVVNVIEWVNRTFNINEKDKLLFVASLGFDLSVYDIFGMLASGGALRTVSTKDLKEPLHLLSIMIKEGITFWDSAPAALQQLVPFFNEVRESGKITNLRLVFLSGDWIQVSMPDALRDTFKGVQVISLGGATEATVWSNYYPIGEVDPAWPSIPYGKPIQNAKYYILDTDLNLCPVLIAGDLYIGGECLAKEYKNDPVLTAAKFIDNPFCPGEKMYKTGDIARWFADGNMQFLGRKDHQVKIRGYRIELGEIESQLAAFPGISEAIVIDRKDGNGNKSICAYYIPKNMSEKITKEELVSFLSKELPDYMVPSYFTAIDYIPVTANGKLDRSALPEPELHIIETSYAAPEDELQEQILKIWQDVLYGDNGAPDKISIGIDDDYFQLGGHSLNATIMMSRIHKELAVKVELREIFRTPTIRDIARVIRGMKKEVFQAITPVEKKEYYPLSSAQKRLYFLQQLDLNSTGYNMPMVLHLGQALEKDKLESILKQLIARHESLRTSIERVNEEVIQRVHEQVEFAIETLATDAYGVHGQIRTLTEVLGGQGTLFQKGSLPPEAIKSFIRPFDLGKAPLIRSGLITYPDGHCTWIIDTHHIVSDGTSQTVLIEDFMQLYKNKIALAPLPVQYKDFAQWQNKLLAGGGIKDQEAYWLQLYNSEIPRLNLPADYKRPEVFTFAGDRCRFRLEKAEAAGFKALAGRYNGTLYMNMMAVLDTLFFKYTGQTDIIIGSGIAGRRHADIQGVVGMFVNTLAIRNYPSGEKTYENFLQDVITNCVKAFENQDVQFEDLVDKLQLTREASRNPLFDISMVVQNFKALDENVGAEIMPLLEQDAPDFEYTNKTAKFDMTFFIQEIADEIQIDIEYYTGIFKEETILRLISHFKQIVTAVIAQPSILLSEIDILTPGERNQVLFDFNDTFTVYPNDQTIHELFEAQVRSVPDRLALIYEDKSFSFRELDEAANRLAHYLHFEKQVQPETFIGILMDRCPEQIIALLGVLKAGAGYLPLDHDLPEARIKNMIDDARVPVVLSSGKFIRLLNKLQWECKSFRTFVCLDSMDVYGEKEAEKSGLMDENLWDYVANSATDEITGGGWFNSYDGEPFTSLEMAEYGDNILKKLMPLLHEQMNILEIGCGSGISMYRIAPRVGSYHGTDLSRGIIENNREKVQQEGHTNIFLTHLAAHEIDRLEQRNFDLVIINSVIQSFHGLNYLRDVIAKAVDMLGDHGYLFLGDILDQELKESIIAEMTQFKHHDPRANSKTKTDWSADLFVHRAFLEDLSQDMPAIEKVEFSGKIHTAANELTRFRYDALITVNKHNHHKINKAKQKYQEDLRALVKFPIEKIPVNIPANNPAYVIYTSGSTGEPKGVVVEHGNVVRLVKNTNYIDHIGFTGKDRFMLTGAFAFDISTFEIWGMLLNGLSLYMVAKDVLLDMERLNETIVKEHISIIHFTPQLFKEIVTHCPEIFASLRCLLVGGDVVTPAAVNRLREKYKHLEILHMYGPTENTTFSTYFPIDKEYDTHIPIGKPISNSVVYILDSYRRLQPIGVPGELVTGGAGIARGYLNNPELTAERFFFTREAFEKAPAGTDPAKLLFNNHSPFYKTGDLARWLPDANIEFLGRIDHQVKIRGYRIEMQEIENRLLKIAGIKEAVVIDRIDTDGSKYLCAYVALDEESRISELRDLLAKVLPDYMIPAYFVPIKAVPLNPNGKVDRKALPDPEAVVRHDGVQDSYVAPRDEVERKLVEIWRDVLAKPQQAIGIDDSFFMLGGHSLKATILVSKLHKEFNVRVPLVQIFKLPRIREFAQYLKEKNKECHIVIEPTEEKEYYELSPAQKRLYILQQLVLENVSYNMSYVISLAENIAKEKLEKIFNILIARHESLRTSFIHVNEEPVQRISKEVDFAIDCYNLNEEVDVDTIVSRFTRPFHLSEAPLFRVNLVTVTTAAAVQRFLFIDMHHIITDGTSQGILEREFRELQEEGMVLKPLRLQYKDYSEWYNRALRRELINRQETYWLKEFSGELPVLDLPTDYPRPARQSIEGNLMSFIFDAQETTILKTIAKEHDITLYMALLAIFNILLAKFSGQEDIIIGTPVAARRHADLQNVIGMLVNTLAMRNFPAAEKPIKDFLQEVRLRTLDAYENQEYPFEVLVDKLTVNRDAGRNPIFDVMLNILNQDDYRHDISRGEEPPIYNHLKRSSRFDMAFSAVDMEDKIYVTHEYSTRLFTPRTIDTFIRCLKHMVRSLPGTIDKKIADLDYIPAEEKEKILELSRGIREIFPGNDLTISQVFEETARVNPDKIALVFKGSYLSYSELNRHANQLARLLREQGVTGDTVVGLMIERSFDMIIAILAILKAGGAYMPIDPEYPTQRILTMLNDSRVSLMLTHGKLLDRFSITQLKDIRNGKINANTGLTITQPRPQIKDFDSIPIPDRSLIDYKKYHQYIGEAPLRHSLTLQATRGCPFNCIYCHKIWPKTHVARRAETIFKEVSYAYNSGVRRFVFIDDIFNFDKKNATRFLETLIKNKMDIQLCFPNGFRADILSKEFIDLLVAAGTVNIDVALESASPRIQKLIRKNLNLDKFKENVCYIAEKYPHVILEMEMMIGFPTETEAEALMTLEFLKEIKWVHFPNLHILKIFPNTDMYRLAISSGVSEKAIQRSTQLAYHELPETLPFSKSFTKQFQARFTEEYFLAKERLLHVIPQQMNILSADELIQKYDSYLPNEIKSFDDILDSLGIERSELGDVQLKPETYQAPQFPGMIRHYFPQPEMREDAFRVLLLDLSQLFSEVHEQQLHHQIEAPLGLMFLGTYLINKFKGNVKVKICKSHIDFDNYQELQQVIREFKPQLIGIRTLTYYKEFFHRTVMMIRRWQAEVPIITGGPYATSDYQLILQDSEVDLVVLGEGEITLGELVEKIIANQGKLPGPEELENIPGIAFAKKTNQRSRKILALEEVSHQYLYFDHQNLRHDDISPANLLYVIYTSGSTGKPKGVMLEQRNLINLIQHQFKHTNIDFSRVLQFTTICFDVSAQEIFSTLLTGGGIYLIDKNTLGDIPALCENIARNNVRTLFLPASFLKFVSSEESYLKLLPSCIRHIVTAGEQPVINDNFRQFLQSNNVYFHNHYGPSEAHVVTALTMAPQNEIPALPSIGRPVANTGIYLVDKNSHLVPVGVAGELYIGGDQVGRGYLNNPELTSERFSKNHRSYLSYRTNITYKTGDRARWLPDPAAEGAYIIEFLGRIDHQVKIRGFRIELGEIENRLLKHPAVKEAVVLVDDEAGEDKSLCAYIVADDETVIHGLRDYLAGELPDYMIPAYFIALEKIPLTPNRKIDRKALPKPNLKAGDHYLAPRDETEIKLARLWSEVLNIQAENISINRSFFELGGHSLKATILTTKIHKEFNISLPLVEVFKSPTIMQLSEYVLKANADTNNQKENDPCLVPIKEGITGAKKLFLIHDGSGEVESYVEFSKHLNNFACWGIRAERLDYMAPAPLNITIPELAERYIRSMKKIQPQGPYYILGWSLGGTIAFEIAAQLEQTNETIAFLALIDAVPPQEKVWQDATTFNLDSEINFIKTYSPSGELIHEVREITDLNQLWINVVDYLETSNYDVEIIKKMIAGYGVQVLPNFEQLDLEESIYYLNLGRTLLNARAQYKPSVRIQTPVHYIIASQTQVVKKEDWNKYATGGINYYEIAGDHFSIFKKPGVIRLSNLFSEILQLTPPKN